MKQYFPAVNSGRLERLATIWEIIEARKSLPAMIVIAGATGGDDTESIARGLAEVAAAAGRRTGYLGLAGDNHLSGVADAYTLLALAQRGSQREGFDASYAGWRSAYDVVIVDVAALRSKGLGAHVARVADGVVIAVCHERRVERADRDLTALLSDLRASVIGVVLTAPIVQVPGARFVQGQARVEATSPVA